MTTENTPTSEKPATIGNQHEAATSEEAPAIEGTPENNPEPDLKTPEEKAQDAEPKNEVDEALKEEAEESKGEGDETSQDTPKFDLQALTTEFQESEGKLSEDSVKAVREQFGLETDEAAQELIDTYAAGQAAKVDQMYAPVYEATGGKEGYGELLGWAGENLSEAEIEAFNKTIEDGSVEQVRIAVEGLVARREASKGTAPRRTVKGNGAAKPKGFSSYNAYLEAVADPRYAQSADYRANVDKMLEASSF